MRCVSRQASEMPSLARSFSRQIGKSSAMAKRWDAIVVGSGPNGLAAAVALAQAGRSVRVLEAADTIGGGTRSAELTLPGFRHDVCSAIHPLALASPFLRRLPLREHGLEFAQPEIPLAHPLDDGSAVVLHRSLAETAEGLGADATAYRELLAPLTDDFEPLLDDLLGPLHVPRHPLAVAASRAPGSARRAGWPARASRGRARERCSPATRRTRCARSTRAGDRGFALML